MRLIFFALLGVNVAALILQLTVWQPPVADATSTRPVATGETRLTLLAEAEDMGRQDQVVPAGLKGGEFTELKPKKTTNSESELAAKGADGVNASRDGLCDMVGPFPALLQAEYLVERLRALEVIAEVRELEVPEGVGYWVHLPPEPSRKEALRRLHEIQAKQIDSYMIPRGELANGISFGMFTRQQLAQARLQEMRDQGYAAEVREITRTHSEVWVVLAPGQDQKIDEKTWVTLLNSENGIKKQQKYCQGVASS